MTQPQRRRVRIDGTAPRRGGSVPPQPTVPVEEDAPDCACPHLDAEEWDQVESDWSDIAFVRSTTSAVLGVPVGYDSTRRGLFEAAAKAGGTVPDGAMLLVGAGKFRRPIMLEVEDLPTDARGVTRPGGFAYSRLLPAPWGDMQRTVQAAKDEAREKYGRDPDDVWVWYLTCRQCSHARNFETLIVAHYKDRK